MKKSGIWVIIIMATIILGCWGCQPPTVEETINVTIENPGTEPGSTVPGDTDTEWQAVHQQTIMSIPQIEIEACYLLDDYCYLYGHGTGFVVSENVVATNYHVAEYFFYTDMSQFPDEVIYYKLKVKYPATDSLNENFFISQEYEVTGVVPIQNRDMALLEVNTLGREPIPITSAYFSELEILSEIMVVGYPGPFEFTGSVGRINELLTNEWVLYWMDWDTKLIKHDALSDRGNSGGPVLNAQGEVIGIHAAAYLDHDAHPLAISIDYLKDYDLTNLGFQHQEIPNPNDYTQTVITELDSEINPIDEKESYSWDTGEDCYYVVETSGISELGGNSVTPVSTQLEMWYGSFYMQYAYAPYSDIYNTRMVYGPAPAGLHTLYVSADQWYVNQPGWYHLSIDQYCLTP